MTGSDTAPTLVVGATGRTGTPALGFAEWAEANVAAFSTVDALAEQAPQSKA